MVLLQYRLNCAYCILRSSTYWPRFIVSTNFSIDTSISTKVWIELETLEWPSQVTDLLIQSRAILTYLQFNDICELSHVFSCLFRYLYKYLCKSQSSSSLHLYTAMWLHLLEKHSSSVHTNKMCLSSFPTYLIFHKFGLLTNDSTAGDLFKQAVRPHFCPSCYWHLVVITGDLLKLVHLRTYPHHTDI